MRVRIGAFSTIMLFSAISVSAFADRTVLAPNGETLSPNSFKTQFAITGERGLSNRQWLQYSSPSSIELEIERIDLRNKNKKGYAFNVQYPIYYSLNRAIPSISAGVRDLFGTSEEHGAFYLATSKSIALSDDEYKIIRELKLDLGVGTGRIAGFFAGIQAQLRNRVRLNAEVYRRKVNLSVTVPLMSGLEAKAYSLDNHLYYGLSYNFIK